MDLPGEHYQPGSSDEGYAFLEQWCTKCQRDKAMREGCDFDDCDDDEQCDIIAASFRGEAIEWRDTGEGLICTAFVPAGEKVPERCPLTVDMFEPVPNVEVRGSRSAKRGGNQQAQLVGCPARLQG